MVIYEVAMSLYGSGRAIAQNIAFSLRPKPERPGQVLNHWDKNMHSEEYVNLILFYSGLTHLLDGAKSYLHHINLPSLKYDIFEGFKARPVGRKGKDKAPAQGYSHPWGPYKRSTVRGKAGRASRSTEGDGGVEDDDEDEVGDGDDDGDDGGGDDYQGGSDTSGLKFACPFVKYNPIKYDKCLQYQLSTVNAVLQHIQRKHPKQPIHCPVCGQTFLDPDSRDAHITARQCELRNFHYSGLTADQSRRIRERNWRGHGSDIIRWNCLWDILFDYKPRPDSPYIRHRYEETMGFARRAAFASHRMLSTPGPMSLSLAEYFSRRDNPQPLGPPEFDQMSVEIEPFVLDWSQVKDLNHALGYPEDLSFLASDRILRLYTDQNATVTAPWSGFDNVTAEHRALYLPGRQVGMSQNLEPQAAGDLPVGDRPNQASSPCVLLDLGSDWHFDPASSVRAASWSAPSQQSNNPGFTFDIHSEQGSQTALTQLQPSDRVYSLSYSSDPKENVSDGTQADENGSAGSSGHRPM